MELSEKIKLILSGKNISPSIFADEIGIQRSSMSHILAGRNKPSLDIVQKIVKRFPDLGVNWIWDDEKLPDVSENVTVSVPNSKVVVSVEKPKVSSPSQLPRKIDPPIVPVQENVTRQEEVSVQEKSIEKILIFYSDGTFKEFKPS